MNYLVQAIIIIISFNYVRTEVEERCQLPQNFSLECANNSVRTINSTGTNNSQGNLWLGMHLKNELQVLDIAGNVCTYEYSCCNTNSSNEPPQLKIGYKLSTLLKSYNVTIVGELVIIVPELASKECDRNSFENWITSNFTAPEGNCTTTESSTTSEPSTTPKTTNLSTSTTATPNTSTPATSGMGPTSNSSKNKGMNTTREPTTSEQNSTSTNESRTTTTQEPVTEPDPTTTNSSTSTAATSGIDTISSSSEKERMNPTRESTTFKQNGTSTNECSTAGTTSTAATAALCSVLAIVIIAEGMVVLGLAVALYRAKRTAKSANLYSFALNNTYNTCGEMTTRFQDDDTTDDLQESTESWRGDAVNRSMTWSGRNRRRELVPVGSQSMRLPSMTQNQVPPYSQRVLPTPYEEMPSHTFGSPLSVTNPMSILAIEENPYQTAHSEDTAQRIQNLTGSSNHEDRLSNVQEQGMNPPPAEDSDGAHCQFDVFDQEEGVQPERLYQTVESMRDLRQTPTGQENFYQVLQSETLQENPYHVVEPDTPFQQENHYHVLESACTPQEENPYYVLESDETPEQENPYPIQESDKTPEQENPYPVLESDKVTHDDLQDVHGVHNVHQQEDPCPDLESSVHNDPASPKRNPQASPSLTVTETMSPKYSTPIEVHTSTEFTISTQTDSGCDKNSKTSCNPKSGATPDNPQITQAQSTPSTNIVHERPSPMTESVSTTNIPLTPVTNAHSLEESSTGKTEDESKETL